MLAGVVEHEAEEHRTGDEVEDVQPERRRKIVPGQPFAAQDLAHPFEDVRGRDAQRDRLQPAR